MLRETKKKLREERDNAELRAITHFMTVRHIEAIINYADQNNEVYAITMDKIKRELSANRQTNR